MSKIGHGRRTLNTQLETLFLLWEVLLSLYWQLLKRFLSCHLRMPIFGDCVGKRLE